MAWLAEDGADLVRIPADDLFPACTTWLLLPRDTLLRGYALRFIQGLIPWLNPRELHRALETGEKIDWRTPPCWQELQQQRKPLETARKLKTARRKIS